ncbi:MAG: hypothetical protein CL927_19480 [Deltaproteobacteria bacterium]|nr:hypothetical protein [Deltaproteobacteria bacterium]HCH64268.1 hypothetical protein [Deltaproteobacteria bacterium]
MYPKILVDDYSRLVSDVHGSVPLFDSTPEEARVEPTHKAATPPSLAHNAPPLSLESDATRRARTARIRAQQAQALEGPGNALWSDVRTSREDWSDRGRNHEADGGSLASRDDSAPKRANTNHLKLAPLGTRSDQVRSAMVAAKTADKAGQQSEALRHYATAMDCGANDADAHFRMGVLLRKTKGNLRLSLVHLRKATLMKPKNTKYRRALAEVYDQLGFTANAKKQQECIRQLETSATPARSWRFW